MKGVIDRIEGDYAVVELEDRVTINIEISHLPEGLQEGDVIIEINGVYSIDTDETEKRKRNIEKLMGDLFE